MKKAVWAAAIFGILIFSFQNCSLNKPMKFSDSDSKTASSDGGNGQGYDGKIYLLLGELCPDSSNVHAKIVLKSESSGDLVRSNCQDISPVALSSNDFQIDASNPDQLIYQSETFIGQIPFGGIALDVSTATLDSGYSYTLIHQFGTPADNLDTMATRTQSLLQIYENGVALGPAHSPHADIRTLGAGRFSHWWDGNFESLYFSSSDNSNPLSNGRVYSYKILQ